MAAQVPAQEPQSPAPTLGSPLQSPTSALPQSPVSPPVSPQSPVSPPLSPQSTVSPPLSPQLPVSPPLSPQSPVHPPLATSLSVAGPSAGTVTLQEGVVQQHAGYLMRRTSILKRWKKERLFEIVPGRGSTSHDFVKHKEDQRRKSQHIVSPTSAIKPLSTDPGNKDFLSFQVVDGTKKQKEKGCYRAKDVVQMRRFMASLGGTGLGLFSQKSVEDTAPIETIQGLWDVVHPSEGGVVQQNDNENPESKANSQALGELPTYDETVGKLSFYSPKETSIEKAHMSFPGKTLPLFSPQATYPKSFRRPKHDTFRPPYGPPVLTPCSIGYGAEVGLQPNVQVLWSQTQRRCFFIDHVRHITFYKDPRTPKQDPPAPVKKEFKYTKKVEPDLATVIHASEVVRYAANQALSKYKPHGYVLDARGVNGTPGIHGKAGYSGYPGNNGPPGHLFGQHGSDGGDGSEGGPGEHGKDGSPATDGSDVSIFLEGDASELRVSSHSFTFIAKLGGPKRPEVLFVNCRGGDGGHGGWGGPGGNGGRGGQGGYGHRGKDGKNSSHGRGGNGGPGGDGGDGGSGGRGGPGGKGGDGGNAGKGGSCVIKAKDPRLLMLVEADSMNGYVGQKGGGGKGGDGGLGGGGGKGGIGGTGGYGTWTERVGDTIYHHSGYGEPGRTGTDGNDGGNGGNGAYGAPGKDGKNAKNGGILWVVETEDGRPLQQSGVRYEVEVTNFKVVSGIDDGIFEPNERIAVSGVKVINSGLKYQQKSQVQSQNEETTKVKPEYIQSLPLPAGAEIFFPSTNTIKFEPTRFTLPALEPDKEFVVPITFYGRIMDEPSPNEPRPFFQQANFESRAELLGRCFLKSFRPQKLDVQYPVKLASLRCNENVGRGEVAILEIDVRNISQMPYGSCANSGGEVMLQLHLDARLSPEAFGNPNHKVPYTVTYDPNTPDSLYIQMQEIPPDTTIKVEVAIQMDSQAELFQTCYWQADLYLRGKLIEYNHTKIRVSPFYIVKDPPADVLLVTDAKVTRKEFVFWQHILETLNVTVDFWDTARYNGLSVDMHTNTRHPVSWEGRYTGRLILYPHCDLRQLWGVDIARHFHGPNYRDGIPEDLQSGMLLFMPPTAQRSIQDIQGKRKADIAVARHLAQVDESLELPPYYGRHFSQPTSDAPLKWEKKILKQLEKTDMSRLVVTNSRQLDIQSAGFFKYTYGVVDIRRCPLLRSCKFVVVDGSGGTIGDIGCDDMHVSPTSIEIPLASHYGQALLATMFGIPLACKLRLIKTIPDESDMNQTSMVDPTFYLPNCYTMKKAQLAAICLATEIAEEVINCQGTIARMNSFTKDVTENPSAYTMNGATVIKTLQLIKKEMQRIEKHLSHRNVTNATREIKRQCTRIQEALRQVGVDCRKQEPLPSMNILHEDGRLYRTHQYFMKHKLWDITQ